MPTEFAPRTKDEFNSKCLNFKARGIKSSAAAGQTSNHDLLISEDTILTGGFLILRNHAFGDYVKQQVVDVDNVLGLGAGAVLNEFVKDWYISSDGQRQLPLDPGYPAKILAGLYLRVVYISTGGVDVDVITNYYLHKILF